MGTAFLCNGMATSMMDDSSPFDDTLSTNIVPLVTFTLASNVLWLYKVLVPHMVHILHEA